MAHEVLVARQDATSFVYHVEIWTDTTKLLPDGVTPDPNYVAIYEYNQNPPAGSGLTASQYQAQCVTLAEQMAGVVPDPTASDQVPVDPAAVILPATGTTY